MDSAATSGIYLGTNGIRLGAKNVFSVTESGALTAMSADIKGKVQAQTGRIGSVDGVGGWIIEQNIIYADNKTVVLNSSGSYRIYAGSETASAAAFYVMKDGTISATKGNVAGWSIDTEKFLNRPVICAVSNTSGLAGIAHWINFKYKLKGDKAVDKNSELVHAIKDWVDEEYAGGRVTVMTDDELVTAIKKFTKKLGLEKIWEATT